MINPQENIEEYYELESEEQFTEEELNNIIPLNTVKQVNKLKTLLFWDTEKEWIDKQGNKRKGVLGRLNNLQHQTQLLDLILQAVDDYRLSDIILKIMGRKLPQVGFNREFALGIIQDTTIEDKLVITRDLILEFLRDYNRKVIFLMDGDEIISVCAFRENERGFSLDVEIAFRGELKQKQRAILYWHKNLNSIFKDLYDIGYRRLYILSLQDKERLIKVIMKGESPEVFQSCKLLRTGKVNNRIMPYREYLLNLGVKFKKK